MGISRSHLRTASFSGLGTRFARQRRSGPACAMSHVGTFPRISSGLARRLNRLPLLSRTENHGTDACLDHLRVPPRTDRMDCPTDGGWVPAKRPSQRPPQHPRAVGGADFRGCLPGDRDRLSSTARFGRPPAERMGRATSLDFGGTADRAVLLGARGDKPGRPARRGLACGRFGGVFGSLGGAKLHHRT